MAWLFLLLVWSMRIFLIIFVLFALAAFMLILVGTTHSRFSSLAQDHLDQKFGERLLDDRTETCQDTLPLQVLAQVMSEPTSGNGQHGRFLSLGHFLRHIDGPKLFKTGWHILLAPHNFFDQIIEPR
jgi:hypothetical protein